MSFSFLLCDFEFSMWVSYEPHQGPKARPSGPPGGASLLVNRNDVRPRYAASATADGACSCEERARARRALEEALLSTPLRAASIKYNGTCFGKLDTGELVGRKQALGAACAESNDPTCGGSDGGTGVTAASPPRRPPPRAHNCRASAHV